MQQQGNRGGQYRFCIRNTKSTDEEGLGETKKIFTFFLFDRFFFAFIHICQAVPVLLFQVILHGKDIATGNQQ